MRKSCTYKLYNPFRKSSQALQCNHHVISEQEVKEARKTVSALIIKILTSTLSVREALIQFPRDIQDKSLECAWHAIMHYEADEEMRVKDNEYALEQDDYLEMIANILLEGQELPYNIIQNYDEYYEETILPKGSSWKSTIKSLLRFINI